MNIDDLLSIRIEFRAFSPLNELYGISKSSQFRFNMRVGEAGRQVICVEGR
jgi:hypothetical protein